MPVLVEALLPECGLREAWSVTGNLRQCRAVPSAERTGDCAQPQRVSIAEVHTDKDRFLTAVLPGYEAYAGTVRYRLIPGLW
jgi:hypothetical protein